MTPSSALPSEFRALLDRAMPTIRFQVAAWRLQGFEPEDLAVCVREFDSAPEIPGNVDARTLATVLLREKVQEIAQRIDASATRRVGPASASVFEPSQAIAGHAWALLIRGGVSVTLPLEFTATIGAN